MKRQVVHFAALLAILAGAASFASAEVILDRKLPAGWKYRSFAISRSGYKALFLLPDLPNMMLLTKEPSGRLQVFDKGGTLVRDTILEDGYWLHGFTRDDKLILTRGDEYGCWLIKLLEPEGRVLFTADAGGRWPVEALLGGEIALVPGVSSDIGLPCSIIDGRSGVEKFRIGPFSKARPDAFFAAIGKDGLYIAGTDKALFLRSYRQEGKDIWRIENIGGTIESLLCLDDEHFAVRYGTDDFDAHKFMAGNAVIEWQSGKVVFDQKGFQINQEQDEWYRRLHAFVLLRDRGDLVYLLDGGLGVRIPRALPPGDGWDGSRPRRIKWPPDGILRTFPEGGSVRAEIDRTFLIWDLGGSVRIEKVGNIEDAGKPRDQAHAAPSR